MYRGRMLQSRIRKRTLPGHDMVVALAQGHQGCKTNSEHVFRGCQLLACMPFVSEAEAFMMGSVATRSRMWNSTCGTL